ncbi:hypothetical protein PCO31111_03483 [Pandoraea communis]|uniref:Uncharacterized protein n=1 Tax=Pandoraea communis TaxID=2508297 RepID=A0A5E4WVH4_9BURK|nr:hypothetical protein [Pandoraea communis]VVE27584.1 hypothetical protein PCO31111_03483 [Pandoraea communis]
MRKDREWGVVQRLEVEADTPAALLGACIVASAEHKDASHFIVTKNDDGSNSLRLLWTDKGDALPFPLKGAQEMADFISQWLEKRAAYPDKAPDTDGDVVEGFRIDVHVFYDVLRVTPTYIVYGK